MREVGFSFITLMINLNPRTPKRRRVSNEVPEPRAVGQAGRPPHKY